MYYMYVIINLIITLMHENCAQKSTCQVRILPYIMQYTLLYVQVAGFLSNCVVSALQTQLSELHAKYVYSTLARGMRKKEREINS